MEIFLQLNHAVSDVHTYFLPVKSFDSSEYNLNDRINRGRMLFEM